MADMLHLIPPHGVDGLSGQYVVQTVAVCTGDNRRVIRGLCAPLNLQTADSGIAQVVQMVDHAHVPGVHDIRTLFILVHRKILAGTLFLHQRVLVPAGLGTRAPVGIPTGHIAAEQASARIADAHGSVDKALNLQRRRRLRPNLPYLVQTHFPRQNDALRAQIVPRPGAFVVGDAGLRGNVTLAVRRVFARQCEDPHIRHDQRVHPGALEFFQMRRKAGRLVVAGHGIHRAVDFNAAAVGVRHRRGQFLIRKVSGKGAHSKTSPRQINCVRAISYRHFQPLDVPCRAQ